MGEVSACRPRAVCLVAQSELEGNCNGWDAGTVFRLTNGDAWQLIAPRSRQLFVGNPLVRIWRFGTKHMLEIEGAMEVLPVCRTP